ncbi:MAG: hypothetical protein IJU72_09430 [Bacteroidales bacterium]|nr:hypothetical protein [Bacteroidales bacterium]
MKTINRIPRTLQTALLLAALGLPPMACNESTMEQQTATELTDQQTDRAQTSIKHGSRLSYTTTKVMVSSNLNNGAKSQTASDALFKEVQQVDVFVDNEGKRCEEFSRLLEHSHKKPGYDPTLVAERTVRNGQTMGFNAAGRLLYATEPSGAKDGLSSSPAEELLLTCAERSERIQLLLEQVRNAASSDIDMEQLSPNVVRITVRDADANGPTTSVTYLNLKYGVPVKVEAYNSQGLLQNSLLQLYKLVDDVPVLAYEETVGYSTNIDGERVEHKAITHFDNIKLEKF